MKNHQSWVEQNEAPEISQITPENVEVFIEDLTYVKDLDAFH